MSRHQKLKHRRHNLVEVQSIMNSMKTMAYIESHKLSGFIDAQQVVVDSIEQASRDLLNFYPDILPQPGPATSLVLLIGSERGFCGDFNHALFRKLEMLTSDSPSEPSQLISVGHKMNAILEDDPRLTAAIDGASVAEEITSVIEQLVAHLSSLHEQYSLLSVSCLYHGRDGLIRNQKLLPPFHDLLDQAAGFTSPPLLNLSPEEVLLELSDHYLFAVLHQILFISLMEENHLRITHLDGAVKYLDKQLSELTRKSYALRQEEIIEEIEIILLSAARLSEIKPGE